MKTAEIITANRHRSTVFLVSIIGVFLTIALFAWSWHLSLEEYRQRFNYDASARSELVVDYLGEQLIDLHALKRFIEGKGQIDSDSFQAFVKPMLERKGVQAIEWIPAVSADKRAALETNSNEALKITERTADGALIPAAKREIYYPVQFVVPMKENEKAVGFDLGSNPQRLAAIRASIKSGRPQATPRITLVQEKGKQSGFLVFAPVYSNGIHSGFALGVFRAGDMLVNALSKSLPLKLDTTLSDISAQAEDKVLANFSTGNNSSNSIFSRMESLIFPLLTTDRDFDFAGRKWSINVSATPAYRTEFASFLFVAILPTGFLLTFILVLYLNSVLSHRDRAEILVSERTKELEKVNETLTDHLVELEQTKEDLQDQATTLEEEMQEKKLAEQKLKESKETLSIILNSAAEAIYGIDLNGRCTFCNQACLDILGYDGENELLGKNMHDQIHHTLPDGSHFPVHECKIFKAFKLGEGAHVDDEFLWRKDGSSFPSEYWSYPQRKNGEIVGAVITFFDVSERKQMLNDLHNAVNIAESANKAKSQFLANMSHEIRTPMNAVMGMLHLLQRTELSPRQLDYTQKIQLASQTLLSILNDILDFSKIEAGKLELENGSFSLRELLRNLSVILSSAVQDKNIEVLFKIAPDIPHALCGDGLRLQQVLLNLASNAIKFTEQGEVIISVQPIAITAERVDLEFSVRDTGIGIAANMLGQVFSGFVQAEASTTRRFGGTGLGLSISSQLVGLMGAELAVESEPGRGSNFHFTVSLERCLDTPSVERRKTEREVSDLLDHPVSALIVDDNAIAREVLSEMVSSFGWLPETASSGPEAIALVEARTNGHFPFDVIFMDWKMPGMDGMEAAGKLRGLRHGDNAPVVIMVTAHGREFVTENHLEESTPLDGFLVKPVTPSMLFDAVADVTSGRSRLVNRTKRISQNLQQLSGLRLLVAEDNLINQQVAKEILTLEGATVAVAASGRQAVDIILREEQFDAVLMDIQMPDMDGYEATQHIRNVLGLKDLPIIAMTANAMSADRERCFEVGMNDHVGKPFDVDKLVEVLRRICGITAEPAKEFHKANAAEHTLNRPGFDFDTALKRLGNNRTLYARMARAFEKDQGVLIEQLRQVGVGDAANALHTIKGVAATMGAADLSRAAADAESALKSNAPTDEINRFIKEVELLFDEACREFLEVADKLDPITAASETVTTMGTETMKVGLVKLEELLATGNMRASQQYEEIRTSLESGERETLCTLDEAMQRLDFAGALIMCRKIREGLR